MRVAIPKEISSEQRVALVPTLNQDLLQLGCKILFEKGAGLGANYPDHVYQNVEFYDNPQDLYQDADIILKVQPPSKTEITHFKKNAIVLGLLSPARYPETVISLRDSYITSFAMELIPRISRAQNMDALSSQATVAGYKAALIAANMTGRFFPMLTTAAGTMRPSQVLVIGTGVAGLQTIATARRLGAIVKAYDIRSITKEQVESLGATMIEIDVQADAAGGYARELTVDEQQKQQAALSDAVSKAEVVISTALIPGKPAPKIITKEMVERMAHGALIVDIAAESGGNCELTQADKIITHKGITISGPINLPSMVARDASNMYAKNLLNFLKLLIKNNSINIDWEDAIIAESVLTHQGIIRHQPTHNFIEGLTQC